VTFSDNLHILPCLKNECDLPTGTFFSVMPTYPTEFETATLTYLLYFFALSPPVLVLRLIILNTKLDLIMLQSFWLKTEDHINLPTRYSSVTVNCCKCRLVLGIFKLQTYYCDSTQNWHWQNLIQRSIIKCSGLPKDNEQMWKENQAATNNHAANAGVLRKWPLKWSLMCDIDKNYTAMEQHHFEMSDTHVWHHMGVNQSEDRVILIEWVA